jgi:hypothetical protein
VAGVVGLAAAIVWETEASIDAAEDHPPPSRKELDMKLII